MKAAFLQTFEGYYIKGYYIQSAYIPKSPKKDISNHFLELDILGI
jgi:hypothetical protein